MEFKRITFANGDRVEVGYAFTNEITGDKQVLCLFQSGETTVIAQPEEE